MAPRKAKEWDDYGRVCANPDCHKAGEMQPWSNFHKDRGHSSGHKSRCADCINNAKSKNELGVSECQYCGDYLQSGTVCNDCAGKAKRYQGRIYLCVSSPEEYWVGGHHTYTEMREMVLAGYWPEGSEFELWKARFPWRKVRVVGTQCREDQEVSDEPQELVEIQGWVPQGDGVFLKEYGYVMFQDQYPIAEALLIAEKKLGAHPDAVFVHPESELADTLALGGLPLQEASWLPTANTWGVGRLDEEQEDERDAKQQGENI